MRVRLLFWCLGATCCTSCDLLRVRFNSQGVQLCSFCLRPKPTLLGGLSLCLWCHRATAETLLGTLRPPGAHPRGRY